MIDHNKSFAQLLLEAGDNASFHFEYNSNTDSWTLYYGQAPLGVVCYSEPGNGTAHILTDGTEVLLHAGAKCALTLLEYAKKMHKHGHLQSWNFTPHKIPSA